jgi:hypothetical protein
MRASRAIAFTLASVPVTGCASNQEDTGPFNCLSLGGGYEGADLDHLEEVCLSGGGSDCDPEEFIEADAARCVSVEGRWEEGLSVTLDASLAWVSHSRRVMWAISKADGSSACTAEVDAVTGEWLHLVCV